jgi:hypothetical protein
MKGLLEMLKGRPDGTTHFIPQNKYCDFAWVKVEAGIVKIQGTNKDDNVWRKAGNAEFVTLRMIEL